MVGSLEARACCTIADAVVLIGGGYINAATLGHMAFQFSLQKNMVERGHSFAILSLNYTLAPHALYPEQLWQAVSALSYLLEKRDPSTASLSYSLVLQNMLISLQILLGGDSAGGNLVAALLLHLARPHPLVPAIDLTQTLHGAMLISPWVSFDTTYSSYTRNADTDYLCTRAINRASHAFIGRGQKHDEYSQPIVADASWWKDVASRVVDRVMIWSGGGEILLDGIHHFAETVGDGFAQPETEFEKYESHNSAYAAASAECTPRGRERVTLIETPKCAHEEMIIDLLVRIREKKRRGLAAREIEAWLERNIG